MDRVLELIVTQKLYLVLAHTWTLNLHGLREFYLVPARATCRFCLLVVDWLRPVRGERRGYALPSSHH